MKRHWMLLLLAVVALGHSFLLASEATASEKPRVIVNTDGEIDDQCSMVRFLLYADDFDVEGIVTTSSQYHAHGHKWPGDDWIQPYLKAYAKVYPNLIKNDPNYPTPKYLQSVTRLGNVKSEGDMSEVTPGSKLITHVLLEPDHRPVWLLAWGGANTIARALKTIEEKHPEKMAEVAKKIRLFLIWEQDNTYQDYIRPHWGKYHIQTIISDQFLALFYKWKRTVPKTEEKYFSAPWMNEHILENHGPLCALYPAHKAGDKGFKAGDFRSEGDSPSFLHLIVNGLRSDESPDWGGWGGRYVRVRNNTWLDPVPEPGYQYPTGRWYTATAWGRQRLRKHIPNDPLLKTYLHSIYRWMPAFQKDFAARADWCVKPYDQANHPPVVKLTTPLNMKVHPGEKVSLSAKGTTDPDGNALTCHWWEYQKADTYPGSVHIEDANTQSASMTIPADATAGQTIHIICQVTDNGTPPLTRYQRVVMTIDR